MKKLLITIFLSQIILSPVVVYGYGLLDSHSSVLSDRLNTEEARPNLRNGKDPQGYRNCFQDAKKISKSQSRRMGRYINPTPLINICRKTYMNLPPL
jgi:hypothetical protein